MSRSATGLDEIDDPGEYNQRRRLRAIHDARERVLEQRRHALDLRAVGHINQRQYQSVVREAVESFIMEIEQLLKRFEADAEPNLDDDGDARPPSWYLEDAPLGTATIPPTNDAYEFRGLQSVLEFPDPYVASWQDKERPPAGFSTHPHGETQQRSEKVQIPEQVLLNAVRCGMEFLNAVGLDAEVEDTTPEFGFREVDEAELADIDFDEVPLDDRT